MRFWIVTKNETVDAIIEALQAGTCTTEKEIEAIAAQFHDNVTWAKNWDKEI